MLAAARAEVRRREEALVEARDKLAAMETMEQAMQWCTARYGRDGTDPITPPTPADHKRVDEAQSNLGTDQHGSGRGERSALITSLFRAEPDRWWKAREVADALGGLKANNIRMSLNHMTRMERLIKSPDARYRLAPSQIPDPPALVTGQADAAPVTASNAE
ncbi:hypothetical protein ABZ897_43100 [Nonomuraea sp. NPDC046802]|uniref:hypothetical protein n=1 Tax=Nonomuraea sp. NPDC046802 TaxID=3154919 RepID=UPI0033D932EA